MSPEEYEVKRNKKDDLWDDITAILGDESHKLGELVELEYELERECGR